MLSVKDASIEALTEELKGKDKMLKAKKVRNCTSGERYYKEDVSNLEPNS